MLPDYHEDDPRAALWIDRIAELSMAQQQGRLAAIAVQTATRNRGPADGAWRSSGQHDLHIHRR
jgi:hypothetical protein